MEDGYIEIDERFMPDWVAYGLNQLESFLRSRARFDEFYAQRDLADERQTA
jgi:hypothetical protein